MSTSGARVPGDDASWDFSGYLGDGREAWRDCDACVLFASSKRTASPIPVDQGTNDQCLRHHARESAKVSETEVA